MISAHVIKRAGTPRTGALSNGSDHTQAAGSYVAEIILSPLGLMWLRSYSVHRALSCGSDNTQSTGSYVAQIMLSPQGLIMWLR